MQDKESDGSSKLHEAIDYALIRFVTGRLAEKIRNDILTAIKEAGMVIVPREPSDAVLYDGALAICEWAGGSTHYSSRWVGHANAGYRAMITAGEE